MHTVCKKLLFFFTFAPAGKLHVVSPGLSTFSQYAYSVPPTLVDSLRKKKFAANLLDFQFDLGGWWFSWHAHGLARPGAEILFVITIDLLI